MKQIFYFLFIATFIFGCKSETDNETDTEVQEDIASYEPIDQEAIESAVIYEANIRQYSPEGTFDAFTEDIPQLRDLGVRIIWVMPINPISEIKRKATGDKFTSEIEDPEERKKYLGSYYSVSDYKAINPEFGTMEDFKELVDTAHENGIYVIIDWVPNHTGWDHPWITDHPDYYTQNEKGEIIDPINPDTGESWGWTDTADLNYDNMEMRQEMINDLKFWVENADIDGYRMDVAHKVPVDFFETVTRELKEIKPNIFMLAEAEQPDLLKNAFDMHYGWEVHHIFNEIAKGNMTVKAFDEYMEKTKNTLEEDDINMNFVTNHDENSWNGTLKERMPDSKEIFTALAYTMPGMPLIYSGQEYDMEKRLRFFEKDTIPKTKGRYYTVLQKLGELKNSNEALSAGENAGSYERMETANENILMFQRKKGDDTVIFVGNFSKNPQTVEYNFNEELEDYMHDRAVDLTNKKLGLGPWEYRIFVK
ncbi:MAG: alpha-amylase family glycosyl hydrolase [Flavobacteriaceae bacterium]|nr:alpha-amylase family glycosyl hydrolase [Flavobacteriaceae bacterium]